MASYSGDPYRPGPPPLNIKKRPLPFANAPQSVLWLLGAIVLAHIARILLPEHQQELLFMRFALVPGFLTTSDTPYTTVSEHIVPFFSHAFLHGGFIHLAFNSVAILDIGSRLVRSQGTARFLSVFFVSAAVGGIMFVLLNMHSENPAIGASGAACGLFGALTAQGLLRTRGARSRQKMIWYSTFWFLFLNVGLAAMARMTGAIPIAWEAHLGGFLAGFAMTLVFRPPAQSG